MVIENHYKKWFLHQRGHAGLASTFRHQFTENLEAGNLMSVPQTQIDDGNFCGRRTTAVLGNYAGYLCDEPAGVGSANNGWQRRTRPNLYFVLRTDTDVSSAAFHCGLSQNAVPEPDAVQHEAKFWYDTNVHSDGFWRCHSDNASGSPEVTVTSVSISASTRYEMQIDMDSTTSIVYSINGNTVATHTTKLPNSSTYLGTVFVVKNRAAAIRGIMIARAVITTQ